MSDTAERFTTWVSPTPYTTSTIAVTPTCAATLHAFAILERSSKQKNRPARLFCRNCGITRTV